MPANSVSPYVNAGCTLRNQPLLRVTLDSGEYVDCTYNHKFMLRDGSYKEAQYLTEDDETETNIKIDKLYLCKGQNFLFHYDFGDDWMFTVHVNKIEEVTGRIKTMLVGEKGSIEQYPDWDDEDDEF